MREKIIYITDDGVEFDNKTLATMHEDEVRKNSKEFELTNGKKISKGDINIFFDQMVCLSCPYSTECSSISHLLRENGSPYNLCQIIHGGIK